MGYGEVELEAKAVGMGSSGEAMVLREVEAMGVMVLEKMVAAAVVVAMEDMVVDGVLVVMKGMVVVSGVRAVAMVRLNQLKNQIQKSLQPQQ